MRKLMSALGAAILVAGAMAVPAAAVPPPPDYTAWVDLGVVYGAGSVKAYYPSVTYDASAFGVSGDPTYKMWYSDGSGSVFVTTSPDGVTWSSPPTPVNGLDDDAHHVQVVYDANCFTSSCDSSAPKYKIWYWDGDQSLLYSIQAIRHATSSDGVAWDDDQVITQDPTAKLVTGTSPDWNTGSYGPIDVFYQQGASDTGGNPWNYSFVMYYDGTDGSSEVTGLAYSADGLDWTAASTSPVLDKGASNAWDCDDAAYGTVFKDANGYHFWYSGGGGDNGSGGCSAGDPTHEGIGYASSSDGLAWTKDGGNPIFHISDLGASHRSQRTYTPSVIDDGSGFLKMYYSAVSGTSDYAVGLAVLDLIGPCTTTCYVDAATGNDAFGGSSWGTAKKTIQAAVNQVTAGGDVIVAAGTYIEVGQIVIDKDLSIVGAGAGTTIIKPSADTGSSGDARGWFLVNADKTFDLSDVTLDGTGRKVWQAIRNRGQGTVSDCAFTDIKYEESASYAGTGMAVFGSPAMNVDVTNCTFSEIGRVGVLYYGSGVTGSTFSGNTYTGKGAGNWLDYAVEVGAGATATITRNTISGNTGVASDGSTSAGILVTTYYGAGTTATTTENFVSGSTTGVAVGYDAFDTSAATISNNSLTGNTKGVESTAPLVDASGNWWGDNTPSGVASQVSADVDYTPWLDSGTDTDGGTPGFQGDFSSLDVDDDSPQTGSTGRVQEGVNLVSGSTVNVAAGTYAETVTIAKPLTLNGAQAGIDARGRSASETIVSSTGVEGTIIIGPAAGTVTIDGFDLSGTPTLGSGGVVYVKGLTTNVVVKNTIIKPSTADGMLFWNATSGTAERNWIKGAALSGITGGRDAAMKSDLTIQDNRVDSALYGITGYLDNSTISGNQITGTAAGAAGIGGQFYDTLIEYNDVAGYSAGAGLAFVDYLSRGMNGIDVEYNTFTGNAAGVYVAHDITGLDIVLHRNSIAGNSAGAVNVGLGTLNATCNWWGASDGPNGSGSGGGDTVSTGVTFAPWLVSSDLNGACYTFQGFFQPVDNNNLNIAKAGQTIPVRWRLTDGITGDPIGDPGSFVKLASQSGTGACTGLPSDAIETYAGGSGLVYLGDGNWQFNWKTPKAYAGQCRTMTLTLADGSTHTAAFQFK